MAESVDAVTMKSWLSDGREIAFIDVREHGQYGEGHPFFAVSIPYSRFELMLPSLVPNPHVRLVLVDAGDGVAERAAGRASALGYEDTRVLAGGVSAWQHAGFTLFAGVNVPSKTFGELVELERHTPRIAAEDLQRMRAAGERHVIIDGRPLAEFNRMSIPGGICCPNGELALRIREIVADPATRIIVNCAGRTRSIIGAQTLIDLGIRNEVYALENGTQGWFLAGFELERGATRYHEGVRPHAKVRGALAAQARALAAERGVRFVSPDKVAAWLGGHERTTYLFDIRSPEESSERPSSRATAAPGGQLIQATDQWVGVKGARLVLVDDDGVRAPIVAQWLRQLGHEADVLDGGVDAAVSLPLLATAPSSGVLLPVMTARELASAPPGAVRIIDVRSSADYRERHIQGAVWSIRPRLEACLPFDRASTVVVVNDGTGAASLAAEDLFDAGCRDVRLLKDGLEAWKAAGLVLVSTSHEPRDEARIDYLFFVHDRHAGNADAARRYLAWEMSLLAQLDAQERGQFRIAAG